MFSKRNYEPSIKVKEEGWMPIGVTQRYDEKSNDIWVVNVDGEEKSHSSLENVMMAHGVCVIRKHGTQTKRSYLNLPERYSWLFADVSNDSKKNERPD